MKSEIVLFTDGDKNIEVQVSPDKETVWLTQKQMEVRNTVGDTLMGKNIILVFKKLDNISYILYTIVKERKKDGV